MKYTKLISLVAVTLAGTGLAHAAGYNAAVEYSSAGTLVDSRPFTLGYMFSLSTSETVDGLAYFDDSLGNNHDVGIWDSAGNLIVSTTVLGTDTVQGHFQWHTISDLVLGPGTYTIGGEFLGNNDPFPAQASGVITIPGYTWLGDEQIFGSGLNYPTVPTFGGYGSNGILMADFSVKTSSVPDATSTLALLAGAMVGLGAFVTRSKNAIRL